VSFASADALTFSASFNKVRRPWWFVCPSCSRRSAILYAREARFVCRTCHRLSYRSQSETLSARGRRKEAKVLRQLGSADADQVSRPKGMHFHTFLRHKVGLLRALEMKNDGLMKVGKKMGLVGL
jgi:hypothetical protein